MSQQMENNEIVPTPSFSQDTNKFWQGYQEQGEKIKVSSPQLGRRPLALAIVSVILILLFSCPTLVFVFPAFSGANGWQIVITSLAVLIMVLFTIFSINYFYYKRH